MSKTKTILAFILVSAPCFIVPAISFWQGQNNVFLELARAMLRLG